MWCPRPCGIVASAWHPSICLSIYLSICPVAASRADYASLGDGRCVALGNEASTAQCASRTFTKEAMCRHECDWLEACIGYTWQTDGALWRIGFRVVDSRRFYRLSVPLRSRCVRAGECILFASFGTSDETAELKASLSQPDWECKGTLPVTASSGQSGPRCQLKGECTLCRPS